jgi:hypothetical protein
MHNRIELEEIPFYIQAEEAEIDAVDARNAASLAQVLFLWFKIGTWNRSAVGPGEYLQVPLVSSCRRAH